MTDNRYRQIQKILCWSFTRIIRWYFFSFYNFIQSRNSQVATRSAPAAGSRRVRWRLSWTGRPVSRSCGSPWRPPGRRPERRGRRCTRLGLPPRRRPLSPHRATRAIQATRATRARGPWRISPRRGEWRSWPRGPRPRGSTRSRCLPWRRTHSSGNLLGLLVL